MSPPPLSFKEGDVIKFSSKSVYLLENGTLHEFPNADTFIAYGYEWNQITSWPQYMLFYVHIGEPIKPIRTII